jgi:hypothetical protein
LGTNNISGFFSSFVAQRPRLHFYSATPILTTLCANDCVLWAPTVLQFRLINKLGQPPGEYTPVSRTASCCAHMIGGQCGVRMALATQWQPKTQYRPMPDTIASVVPRTSRCQPSFHDVKDQEHSLTRCFKTSARIPGMKVGSTEHNRPASAPLARFPEPGPLISLSSPESVSPQTVAVPDRVEGQSRKAITPFRAGDLKSWSHKHVLIRDHLR